jgi:hypothetical protein
LVRWGRSRKQAAAAHLSPCHAQITHGIKSEVDSQQGMLDGMVCCMALLQLCSGITAMPPSVSNHMQSTCTQFAASCVLNTDETVIMQGDSMGSVRLGLSGAVDRFKKVSAG